VDDDWCDDDLVPDPPCIDVDIEGPQVLAYLYGPNGDPIATLLDRPPHPRSASPNEVSCHTLGVADAPCSEPPSG